MASISKRPGKRGTTYKVSWRLPSGQQRTKTFKTYDEAKAHKVEVEGLERRGVSVDPQRGAVKLSAWSEDFMATRQLKPKSEASYRSLLRSRILPTFGDVALSSITRLDVQQWVAAMRDEISPKRVREAHALLSQMLKEAVAHDRLLRNPAQGVKLPQVVKSEVEVLTLDELKAVAGHCGRYKPLVLFLGVMGVRWAEAVGLTWDKVKDGVVTIDSSLSETNGKFSRESTKTNETRRLPLPDWLSQQLPERSTGLVFTTTYDNPIRSAYFRNDVWRPALKSAEVEPIRIHALRHTCASLLINQGASIVLVSRWLGHKDVNQTLSTYSHMLKNDLDEIAKKMDSMFSGG